MGAQWIANMRKALSCLPLPTGPPMGINFGDGPRGCGPLILVRIEANGVEQDALLSRLMEADDHALA